MTLHSPSHDKQKGLTLVELMIALTLGLIVIAALVGMFLSSNRNYRQNEALAALQDNARFALDSLSRDLAMAGYWGGVRPVDASVNIRVSTAGRSAVAKGAGGDCGPSTQAADYFWLFDVSLPIVFRNYRDTASLDSRFTCLLPTDVQSRTDVVMIRRVAGSPVLTIDASGTSTTTPGNKYTPNRYYVKSSQNVGSLFRAGATFDAAGPTDCADGTGANAPCPPNGGPVQVYAYTPQIYYIRSYLRSRNESPKIPILCRRFLNDSAAMEEDCLAEGVENLQIEWGLSSGVDGGAVENYTSTLEPADVLRARTARIHILVRSTGEGVAASSDEKTFNLGDDLTNFTPERDIGPTGATLPLPLRRAFTTTVQLKNLQPAS